MRTFAADMSFQDARAAWAADRAMHEKNGVILPSVIAYLPEAFKNDYRIAMDALGSLGHLAMDAQAALTTDPNSAIPAFLTTMIDPAVFRILFAPTEFASIFGETRKGSWLDTTAMFPVVEHTGEVSSYGDYSNNGSAGANTNWPQRQSYLYQTVKQYGERELAMAGLGRVNWVSELDEAAATVMNRYLNYTYAFGVSGLQNYGWLNDPNLPAALTPATKAAGGVAWINASGVVVATANEVFTDIQTMFQNLVAQNAGLVNAKTPMVLAMSPGSEVALTATNSFNVNVYDLLKKNFPNIEVRTAVQYGRQSTQNPQGISGGNLVQLVAKSVDGQDTGYCSFNEKMRSHPIIRDLSAFKQKVTGGTWGAIIRMPVAVVQMLGV